MSQAKFRKLSSDELLIDPSYQRPIDEKRVARMADDFRPEMLGALEVSQRNGHFAVFDGQHRLAAAKLRDFDTLPCLVHTDMTVSEEADLFNRLQRDRKGVHPVDAYKARLTAGDPTITEIEKILSSTGFAVRYKPGPAAIASVKTLERVYQRGNLADTLKFITDAWGGDPSSTDWTLIEAVSQILLGYADRIGPVQMDKIRREPPIVFIRRAKARSLQQGRAAHASSRPLLLVTELRKAMDLQGPPSVLTPQQVREIRESSETLTALAKRFGVSHPTIRRARQAA